MIDTYILWLFHGHTIYMFNSNAMKSGEEPFHPADSGLKTLPVTEKNLGTVFSACDDFQTRAMEIGEHCTISVFICWLDGLISGSNLSEDILRPLTDARRMGGAADASQAIARILQGGVYGGAVKSRSDCESLSQDILNGCCAIVFPETETALSFEVKSDKMRSISESTLEKSVKGAKDAFIETLRVNTALVRKKLRTPKLKSEERTIGRKSATRVSVMYVQEIAQEQRVQDLLRRLESIDIDGLTASGYLEQYLVDQPSSPFPQMLHTERPDTFASYLLDGRIGILVDGLPIGFAVPAQLTRFMRVTEDRANHFTVASMLILLRYIAFFFALFLPGLYVAIAMYHQEMLPTQLLISIIDAKQQVPFSTAAEVLGMLIAFELLQEAGLRLPAPVGNTVSIIGALIVGQSAVDARIISPIAVIIVAFSGISSYTLPSQDLASAVRVLRFFAVLAAMGAGLFGVMAAAVFFVWHLSSLESYGVAYLCPLVDGDSGSWLWSFLRKPLWLDRFRDPRLTGRDKRRQK